MQQTGEVAADENVLAFIPCDTTGVVLLEGTEKKRRKTQGETASAFLSGLRRR